MGVERTGHIDMNDDPFPGFTSLVVISSNMCGLKYESIVALPFLAPLFIFIFMAILRKISTSSSGFIPSFLIMGIWMLYFGTRPTFFVHSLGLSLFFVVMYLTLLRLERHNVKNINISSIVLLVILLTSINTISYKLMFFTIIFLIVFQAIMWFEKFQGKNISFTNIIRIGCILALSFNWMFYRAFIPAMRASSDHPLEGLSNMVSIFASKKTTLISTYSFVGNVSNAPLYIAWYILIGVSLIACFIIILLKIIKHKPLYVVEICIASIAGAGSLIFILYNPMGFVEISFLLLAGILGYTMLLTLRSTSHKNIFTICLSILFLMTIYMNILAVAESNYGGQTDWNEFQYLKYPTGWFNTYQSTHIQITSTDQLTLGYLAKEVFLLGQSNSYNPAPFSEDRLLFILEPELHSHIMFTKDEPQLVSYYIFNYKEPSFVMQGWGRLKSWSNFKENVHSNPYLNIVYASGDIDVGTT